MRRRGEQRVLKQVLPVAGELLSADDARLERAMPAAGGGEQGFGAGLDRPRVTELDRRQGKPAERLHQPKAGFLVHGQGVAGHDAAVRGAEPDRLRLGDQVGHGEHQAAVDHHAAAGALGAERTGREGVERDARAQADDAAQRRVQIERVVVGVRLQVGRNVPVHFRHRALMLCAPAGRRSP